jgi:16S rRNA (guanine966-N2)-methyltransferase
VVPEGRTTRPMRDRVREALFSALDARGRLRGARVLDLYAGSGALAIEALSRGAQRAVLVERDRSARDAIDENLSALGLEARAEVSPREVAALVAGAAPGAPFDLVFCDPPFAVGDDEVGAIVASLLTAPGWLAPDGLVVVQRPTGAVVECPAGAHVAWERAFGDTVVVIVGREPT